MTEPIQELDPLLNIIPDSVATIHIMGVCGTAMAALAGMLKQSGYHITGSDSQVYPPMSDFLQQIGVEIFSGYKSENLRHKPDLVIVGNVITKINPEAQALAFAKIPYVSMPQAISHFFINSRKSLVISGTHGKTTTSSMLASALHSADADPTFMIGGILHEFKSNYRIGSGPYFVAEGDEYDTAFFNKVSKFLHYRPEVAVITSLEFDHADIFDSLDDIKKSFKEFVSLLPAHGLIIANTEDQNVREVIQDAPCSVKSYGTSTDCDWHLSDIQFIPGKTLFTLNHQGQHFEDFQIQLPGLHNCMNATAVIAIMHHLGFKASSIRNGLQRFCGVKRRQEIRGTVRNITVIDDFAHHPTAVRETLKALKHAYPQNRLVAVFEPRTNTSRRAIFQRDYTHAFGSADLCIIRDPAPAKLIDRNDLFSSNQLADDLTTSGKKAYAFTDTDLILAYLQKEAMPGDIIAILSNGGFDNIHERLLNLLSEAES